MAFNFAPKASPAFGFGTQHNPFAPAPTSSEGFVYEPPVSKLKASSKKVVKRINAMFEQEQDCDVTILIEKESGEIAEINAHSFILAPYPFFSQLINEKCAKGKNKKKVTISIDKSITSDEEMTRNLIRSLYGFEFKPEAEPYKMKQQIAVAVKLGLVHCVVGFMEKLEITPGMEMLYILKELSKPNVTGISEQNREKYCNRYLQYIQTKSNMICNSVTPEIIQFASENPVIMAKLAFKLQTEAWFRIAHFADEALIEQMRTLYTQVMLGDSTTSSPIPNLSSVKLVTADEKTVHVPKAILSTGSAFLKQRIEMQEAEGSPVIDLTEEGISSTALTKCLEYLFTGDVSTDDSSMFSVLKTAATLKMNGLMQFIRKRMQEMTTPDLIHNFSMFVS